MKIRTGDNVIVIAGKDKGKTGKVIKSMPRTDQVIVDGVNMIVRHQKSRRGGQKGQILEKQSPVHVSNVMLIDPQENKRTRIGMKIDGGKRTRVAKKSGTTLVS